MRYIGRKRPFSVEEMKRQKCRCCGRPAKHQWNCCANDGRHIPICVSCDVALNEMALAFFWVPGRGTMMAKYRRGVSRRN